MLLTSRLTRTVTRPLLRQRQSLTLAATATAARHTRSPISGAPPRHYHTSMTLFEEDLSNSKFKDYTQNFIRIGDLAPNFDADTTHGKLNFYEYLGNSWGVLFSHPADFTPVCTTELGKLAKLKPEFDKRNVKVIAISVDTIEHHHQWVKDINEIGNTTVNYPIIADTDRKVSVLYGMLDQTHLEKSGQPMTVRSVFITDPSHIVRLMITYPAATGRNFAEILRVIDSLQLASKHKVATPADWQHGEDTVVLPTVPNDEANKLFPKGFKQVRPWLRLTPDPSAQQSA